MRNNQGKPQLDYNLIGWDVLEAEARVWEHGGREYAPGNWLKGTSYREAASSLLRHLTKFMNGEDIDPIVPTDPTHKPGSGCHHIAHVICCAKILLNSSLNRPDLDDRTIYHMEVGTAREPEGLTDEQMEEMVAEARKYFDRTRNANDHILPDFRHWGLSDAS
jgi:hypothetical protein